MTVDDVVKAVQSGEVLLTEVLRALVDLLRVRSDVVDGAVRAIETAADVAEDAKLASKGGG